MELQNFKIASEILELISIKKEQSDLIQKLIDIEIESKSDISFIKGGFVPVGDIDILFDIPFQTSLYVQFLLQQKYLLLEQIENLEKKFEKL